MKNILVISDCPRRGGSTGLTGAFVVGLSAIAESCKVDLFDTSFFTSHKGTDYKARYYYKMPGRLVDKIGLSIPHLSAWYKESVICKKLTSILKNVKYDLIVVYQVPLYSDRLVEIAHRYGVKTLLRPWGSEVLRVNDNVKKRLLKAYSETDFVGGDPETNVIQNAINVYGVQVPKIVNLAAGLPGVRKLMETKGTLTKEEMKKTLDIPFDSNVIVCGYNAYAGQHHPEIIDQISSIKQYLPNNTLLVFLLTYGGDDRLAYIEVLKQQCEQKGIKALFFSDFLTAEQMAYLHLVTDMFINVQPTDSGNAFLVEALYSENTVICGKWLDYPQLQKYGVPFYQCESLDTLGETIKGIITGASTKIVVPKKLTEEWTAKNRITFKDRWTDFLNKI